MKKIDEKYFINPKGDVNKTRIEDSLEEDEKILWQGKPLRKSFLLNSFIKLLPFAIIWLGVDVFFIVMLCSFTSEIPTPLIIFLCFFFLIHLLPVWIWIYNVISASKRQKIEEYAFTNKRILVKQGFIGSTIISVFYSSIDSVNLKVGVIEKICHVGDIYIVSKNQKIVLEDINDPLFITQKLQAIANDIKTDIYFPNSLRPKENEGYKTEYKDSSSIKK